MKSDKSSKCMQANLRTQHLTININKQQLKGHKLKQCKQTLRSAQVYKDPVFACTMATKAVWAELARKRCTLLKSSPGSPQHGSWFCGKRDWTFQRHARLLTTKGLHRFQRKDVWKLLQTPSSKAKTHHDNTNHSRCARCGGKSVTLVAPAISVNICQYPSMSPTMSYHVLPWSWHAGTVAPLNFSQLLYVLCLATAAPVIWKDPWWTKPTDHNGQYTQSTPGNTFQRSAAGAKASENGLKIAVILDDTTSHCTRKLHDKRWRVTSPQSACKPICAHNISQ